MLGEVTYLGSSIFLADLTLSSSICVLKVCKFKLFIILVIASQIICGHIWVSILWSMFLAGRSAGRWYCRRIIVRSIFVQLVQVQVQIRSVSLHPVLQILTQLGEGWPRIRIVCPATRHQLIAVLKDKRELSTSGILYMFEKCQFTPLISSQHLKPQNPSNDFLQPKPEVITWERGGVLSGLAQNRIRWRYFVVAEGLSK